MTIGTLREKQVFLLALSIWAAVLGFGCAVTPERLHPEFERRIQPVKTLYLMPPDVRVFQPVAPGQLRPDAALSRKVADRFARRVIRQFQLKQYRILDFSPATHRSEIGDIMALYRAVNKSIQLHTYGPSIFPQKRRHFEYSVGALETLLAREGADGVLFARVRDRNTPGRYRTYVSLAVADSQGDILWYSAGGIKSAAESRNDEPTGELIRSLVHSFPEALH